ncbi:hypothetical protein V6N11_021496 [Hibiscus sabdariffa]|uniref:Hexosyltransferase n=2 Tax=Hibiscus sabdariffa TaxID=183260 RepID=A0ABR2BF97_9ROSI
MMRYGYGLSRRKPALVRWFLILYAAFTSITWLMLTLRSLDALPITTTANGAMLEPRELKRDAFLASAEAPIKAPAKTCATVEEMGKLFKGKVVKETLRVRRIIQTHFSINGAPRIRGLPPEHFYRHGGKYPFGDYILYSNLTFTLREVKHLQRQNGCVKKYGRLLVMRIDDFEKPTKTNVLCGNWRKWRQPIIWYQGTIDAVATQFFLKNVHPIMRTAASELFGKPESLLSRPNVFGELMRILISPSRDVEEAVNWVIGGSRDPDITLHMRMLMNRSVRAAQAALNCLKRAARNLQQGSRPRVLHFDYGRYRGNVSRDIKASPSLEFRVKEWGPAPRGSQMCWDYAQLIAALAAANSIGENSTSSRFSFLSSFRWGGDMYGTDLLDH